MSDSDASAFKIFSTCNVRMRSRISNSDTAPTVNSKFLHNFDIYDTDQSTHKAQKKVSALKIKRTKQK